MASFIARRTFRGTVNPPWWRRTGSVGGGPSDGLRPVLGTTQKGTHGGLFAGPVRSWGFLLLWVASIGGVSHHSADTRRSVRENRFLLRWLVTGGLATVLPGSSHARPSAVRSLPRVRPRSGRAKRKPAFKCTEPGRLQEVSGVLFRRRASKVSQDLRT